jgi:tellurite methyltransferase
MAETASRRWDTRYRGHDAREREPSPFLESLDGLLPCRGRALDVAGGTGRNALWLARRGLDVTLADISDVALTIARERAAAASLPLRTLAVDLEARPLPPGPWDLIVCAYFLWRPLFVSFPQALAPDGWLVVIHPTRSNLQRHDRPGPHHLLDDGELPGLVPGLVIVRQEEGWTADGHHEARLVARRRDPDPG